MRPCVQAAGISTTVLAHDWHDSFPKKKTRARALLPIQMLNAIPFRAAGRTSIACRFLSPLVRPKSEPGIDKNCNKQYSVCLLLSRCVLLYFSISNCGPARPVRFDERPKRGDFHLLLTFAVESIAINSPRIVFDYFALLIWHFLKLYQF